MQDIIPPKKRSIRDIPLPESKNKIVSDFEQPYQRPVVHQRREVQQEVREVREEIETEEDFEEFEQPVPQYSRRQESAPRKKISKRKIVITSILAFAFIFVVLLVSRQGAKVYIYAKEMTQSSSISIGLNYTPSEMSSEKTVSVKATGEEQVTEKSKGRITIYNEYEEEEQRLLKNTRFESTGGLIFRIPDSVVVPGLKRDDKGNVIPGKLEVEVLADQAGEEYNIAPGRFTVPGFKDLPQYNSFYAISEKPTEGGFDGIRKVISQSDRQTTENTLKAQLKDELIKASRDKTNEETLVLADESMIIYEILGDKVDGDNVSISARGTIKAASFNFSDFSNSVARALIPQFSDKENVIIKNIDDLNISVSKSDNQENKANIDISGGIEFLWKNDHESLKETLAGTNKNDINKTIEMFPGIEKVSAEISPFWKKVFPEDASKIKIIDSKN